MVSWGVEEAHGAAGPALSVVAFKMWLESPECSALSLELTLLLVGV